MSELLEKLIRERREKEERKRQREEERKRKLEEKKKLKKIEHKKKLRKKQNRRAYLKRRKVELDNRKAIGDEYAYFLVLVTKNRKRIKRIGAAWWKSDAYKIFNEAISKNQNDVSFPVNAITKKVDNTRRKNDLKYEILIVKKTKADEETVAQIRDDKTGRFVNNVIVDSTDHVIVDKHIWFVEEKFNVYGFHPKKDKKTYDFILNNFILNNPDKGDAMRRILVYNNKLIIQYIEDFDFVICRDKTQCQELYNKLYRDITKMKRKYIVFMGEVSTSASSKWLDRLVEKTGWSRQSCRRINNL